MLYQSFDPNAELNGTSTQCFIKCVHLQSDYFSEIVTQHGFHCVEPTRWYSLQRILDVVNDMSLVADTTADFISLGITAAELGLQLLPADQRAISLHDFLVNYPDTYQSRHHGDVGYVQIEETAPGDFTLRAHIPYPDDVFYGWMWGYARALKAPHTGFAVTFDPNLPRHDQGAHETVLHVKIDPLR